MKRQKTIIATLILALPMAANAGLIGVDRAAFEAAVLGGTISSQDFDGLTAGTLLGTLEDVTYAASGGTPIVTSAFLTSTNPNGLGSTSVGFFLASEIATFNFASAITAFAIDINTFATTDGAYTGFLNTGDLATSIFEVFPSQATGQFLGFISDTPFSSVAISANSGFSYTLDTLVYGDASAVSVPEPGTLALLAIGLAGMALSRRRKQA